MIRLSTILWPLLIGLVAFTLFQVKYKVSKLSGELDSVHSEITQTEASIEVLKAEWAHLNNPTYIRQLTDKYLSDGKTIKAHIGSIHSIPMRTSLALNQENTNTDQVLFSDKEQELPVKDLVVPSSPELTAVQGSLRKQYSLDEIGQLVEQLESYSQ
jgi:hypothetical protein